MTVDNFITLPLVGYIELTRGRKVTVDWEDVEWLSEHLWDCSAGYAKRRQTLVDENGNKHKKTIMMHRAIMERHGYCLEGLEVDHINRDPLCNLKSNLRVATRLQNGANRSRNRNNTSGTTGVTYHKGSNRWRAVIRFQNQWIRLGAFTSKDDAIAARKKAEIEYFGEWASSIDEPNSISNLIELSKVETLRRDNKTGYCGVWQSKGKWAASITIDGCPKHIGYYDTIDEAVAVREQVKANPQKFEELKANKYGGHKGKSGHFGIWWEKSSLRWVVSFTLNGERKRFGSCKNIEDALILRNEIIKANNLNHLLNRK
ncbi:MAG: HNH endonuclease signature motif containing protein [Chroococcidiopsis sp.]